MLYAGVDAGSRAIKVALFDADRAAPIGFGVVDQGVAQPALARELYERVLAEQGIAAGDVARVVATGYGRNGVSFADTTITEITCHAWGVRHLLPEVMTIIEVGGQDSKLIRLDETGAVRDFAMNDRCAAGTGRFMEMLAMQLGRPLATLRGNGATNGHPALISSRCVVFAEAEIVGLLASGQPPEDIVSGVCAAVAQRVATMACRSVTPPVAFTGGVAMIGGMAPALEAALGEEIRIVPKPQLTGALGAALLAARRQTKLER